MKPSLDDIQMPLYLNCHQQSQITQDTHRTLISVREITLKEHILEILKLNYLANGDTNVIQYQ